MRCVEFDTCRIETHSFRVEFDTCITLSQHIFCILASGILSHFFYVSFLTHNCSSCFMCLLLCQSQSSVHTKASEQRSALAIIHLLSSGCTSYFYNISYMFVLFVNASVWQYCQQHSECMLCDPGPIIIIIIIFIVFVVQLISLYFIMQSMSNHCI